MIGCLIPPLHFSRNKQVYGYAAQQEHFFTAKMPKRACPFSETFSSQYKIHVGQQELNHYSVFGNKYRQEVYGKCTLADISLHCSVSVVITHIC